MRLLLILYFILSVYSISADDYIPYDDTSVFITYKDGKRIDTPVSDIEKIFKNLR